MKRIKFFSIHEAFLSSSIYLLGCIFIFIYDQQTNLNLTKPISITFSFCLFNILFFISWSDIQSLLIPNSMIQLGFTLGGIMFLASVYYLGTNIIIELFLYLVIQSFTCFAIMFLINKVGESLIQVNLLGIGDAKLASMCTIWIGGEGIFSSMMIAFLTAGCYSLCKTFTRKNTRFAPIPFAPFISGGVWCVWITGSNSWWNYIQGLFGYLMV